MKATLFGLVFSRYGLPDAKELAQGTMAEVAARIRGSLKSRTKILKRELGVGRSNSLELLAKMLEFSSWHELNQVLVNLEADVTRLPGVRQGQAMIALLVQWPEPAPELGERDPAARVARRELVEHIVIVHAHGHHLARLLQCPLARGLDLAAKLHGAPDWDRCVYGDEYWVGLANSR